MTESQEPHGVREVIKDTLTQPLHVPFSNRADDVKGHPVNATRIVEVVLSAAITALITYIVSIPKLEQKIEDLAQQTREIKEELKSIRHDFYIPFSHGMSVPQPPRKKDDEGG